MFSSNGLSEKGVDVDFGGDDCGYNCEWGFDYGLFAAGR